MLRKITVVGLTVAVAVVVFGCSNDAVTPEGTGTADSKTQNRIYGYCYIGTTHILDPYEGVLVEAWCGGNLWGYADTDGDGYYNIVLYNNCPTDTWYLIIATPPDEEIDPQSIPMFYTIGPNRGPDFYFIED